MLYVFIDTNVLLRFYAYSDDTLAEVEKLSALIKAKKIKLLITEQIVDEHARNRDNVLADSMKRLDQMPTGVQIPRFAEHHEPAQQLMEAVKAAKTAKTELMDAIRSEMAGGGLRADRVILEMFASTKALPRAEEVISKARLRRELGNPPGKEDSLGDQINWEILLQHVPDRADLHVISKDGDFKSGATPDRAGYFLRVEWNEKKRANLHLYNGLSSFTAKHFPDIKVPSDALTSSAIERFINSTSYAQTHAAIPDLEAIRRELTSDEAIAILNAAVENNQIADIAGDPDVADIIKSIHSDFMFDTSISLDQKINSLFKKFE